MNGILLSKVSPACFRYNHVNGPSTLYKKSKRDEKGKYVLVWLSMERFPSIVWWKSKCFVEFVTLALSLLALRCQKHHTCLSKDASFSFSDGRIFLTNFKCFCLNGFQSFCWSRISCLWFHFHIYVNCQVCYFLFLELAYQETFFDATSINRCPFQLFIIDDLGTQIMKVWPYTFLKNVFDYLSKESCWIHINLFVTMMMDK